MTETPQSRLGDALASASRGLAEQAEVWRAAVQRNAAGTYKAEDALVDWQTLWGLALRDASAVWAAMFDAVDRGSRNGSDGDET